MKSVQFSKWIPCVNTAIIQRFVDADSGGRTRNGMLFTKISLERQKLLCPARD